MKSAFNCFTCLGFLLFFGGGFLIAAGFLGGWGIGSVGIGSAVLFIGLVLIILQFRLANQWNKVVGVIKSHERISIQEAGGKSGVSPDRVRNIIYEAISAGDLAGTLEGDTFSRMKAITTTHSTESAKVLVICPYCGGKTEQGLAKCQKCGADL